MYPQTLETVEVKTSSLVTMSRVADLLCSALEGGSNYWCHRVGGAKPTEWPNTPDEEQKFAHTWPCNPGGFLKLKDLEENKLHKLTLAKLKKGLRIMATKYPSDFAAFISDSEDASTADTFLQCCLLGEVLYG